MEELARRVTATTSLEPSIAKAAIGHVLMFLRDQVPEGHVGEFIDKSPDARQFVAAAQSKGDSGVTQAIEALKSFMGYGRADLNILAGKLANLGLNQTQIEGLVKEVLARADILIGPEGIAKVREILPELAARSASAPTMRPGA